jgi:hypothetical protein
MKHNHLVYELTVPQFINELHALKGILRKGQSYAETKKFDVSVFLQTRLAPDQFPLTRQVQIACDTAKACAARLSGTEAPVFEDKESSLDQLFQRIDKTISFLQKFKTEDFEDYESKVIRFSYHPGKHLKGKDYVIQHAIPNFYFHLTTAYSILRANGVELGKGDFLGEPNWFND